MLIFHLFIEYVVTRHADITWNVDFDTKTLVGEVVWHFDIIAKEIEHIVRFFFYPRKKA